MSNLWSSTYKFHPSAWDFEFGHPPSSRIFDQDFGPGVYRQHHRRIIRDPRIPYADWIHTPVGGWSSRSRNPDFDSAEENKEEKVERKEREELSAPPEKGMSEIINDKEKFQVTLDVTHFAPEEITVKTVEDYLVIECKHEERRDEHGLVSRQFTRKYVIPKDIDLAAISSNYRPVDSMLIVMAPKKGVEVAKERTIQINVTPPTPLEEDIKQMKV